MALADLLKNTSKTVEVGGTTVELYPLTISDLSKLLIRYGNETMDLLSRVLGDGDGNTKVDWSSLISTAPEFVGEIMAMATREGFTANDFVDLGFPTQIQLLEAIWDVTVVDPTYLKKTMSRLINGLDSAAQDLEESQKTPAQKKRKSTPKLMTVPDSEKLETTGTTTSA